ncbi:hypothetical protein NGK11_03185 [Raoultella ornithinolytica]|uniref:DUF6904 family protein n=1 Tax=Raoultella ornithinolytica TaxID=54291 RepID=UPI002DBEB890|nr:hypothetical protein [Raoultella ornithinolytica]MEB8015434.1 hypothetical protein [Raoultella ornithinolytica]
MLQYKLTRFHAGFELWGNVASLVRLHEFIHRVVNESSYIKDKEGFILSLAYDVRKAYEGMRKKELREPNDTDNSSIYGVPVLWPAVLVQTSILRYSMSFMELSKLDQSIMFELEYIVETALKQASPKEADELIHRIWHIGSSSYDHIAAVLDSRIQFFVGLEPKQRLKMLPMLIDTFEPMYDWLAKDGNPLPQGMLPPSSFAENDSGWSIEDDFKW